MTNISTNGDNIFWSNQLSQQSDITTITVSGNMEMFGSSGIGNVDTILVKRVHQIKNVGIVTGTRYGVGTDDNFVAFF